VPKLIRRGVRFEDFDLLSVFFIPLPFLRSSTLVITTNEVLGPTEVQIIGRNTANMDLCHVHIDFSKDSGAEHRYDASAYAMGMVQNLGSVSNLRFDLQASFHTKFTPWLKRFSNLKELTLSGPHMSPLLLELVSAEPIAAPSLQRLVLDQAFTQIYRKFRDWIATREQAGYKIDYYLIPVEIS